MGRESGNKSVLANKMSATPWNTKAGAGREIPRRFFAKVPKFTP
jgi:hypothetical protein